MASRNILTFICFTFTIINVLCYVYRPGKRDTELCIRRQISIWRSFIKKFHNVQSRKQVERVFKTEPHVEKTILCRIFENILEGSTLTGKSGKKRAEMIRTSERKFEEIMFLLLRKYCCMICISR